MALIDDLVALYEGADATDSHTGGLDMTEVGTVTYSTGNNGNAIYTTTGGNYIKLANASAGAFDPGTGDYSIAFWYYNVSGNVADGFISFGGNFAGGQAGFKISPQAGNMECIFQDTSTQRKLLTDASSRSDDVWELCVLTIDRDGDMTCYINGANVGSLSVGVISASDIQPAQDLVIGATYNLSSSNSRLQHLGFWKRLLNSDERRWLYNRGAGRAYADYAGYAAPTQAAYSLDDELDFYGGLVDLTNNGSVTFTTGKVSNAASFNGSTQRLSSDSLLYQSVGDEKISIDCWFNADTISSAMGIAGQSNSSYSLQLLASGVLRFRTNHVTDGVKTVDWGSTLSSGTWYYVHAYHDPDTDTIGISVNDGTVVTTATGGNALVANTNDWNIGSIGTGNYFDGLIDQVRFLRGSILTSGERTSTYNSGDGVEFSAGGTVWTLNPPDMAAATTMDAAALSVVYAIASPDMAIAAQMDAATLSIINTIAPADMAVAVVMDPANITFGQVFFIAPANMNVAVSMDAASIGAICGLDPDEMLVSTTMDAAAIAQALQIDPPDMAVATTMDAVLISTGGVIVSSHPFVVSPQNRIFLVNR